MNHDSGAGIEMIALGWVIFAINMTFNWLEAQFGLSMHLGNFLSSILILLVNAAWVDTILTNLHHPCLHLYLAGFRCMLLIWATKK